MQRNEGHGIVDELASSIGDPQVDATNWTKVTVDASEIHLSPVDYGKNIPIMYRVSIHPNGGWEWDFSHQQ